MVQTPDPQMPEGQSPILSDALADARADARAPARADARGQATGNMLCMASMAIWAAGFPAAEILLQTWDPLPLITARLLLSVMVLLPIWVLLDGPRRVKAARWGRGTVVGGLAFGLGTYLLLVAQSLTDAVTVAIIASSSPIAATLIEMVTEGRRLNRGFVLGLLASLLGGYVAIGGGAVQALGLGALAAVGSCFLFSWGSHKAVRDFPDLSPVGRTTITLAGGLIFAGTLFVGAHLMGMAPLPPVIFEHRTMGLLGVYAIGGMALSQLLWIASVGRLGVAVASFHINIAPFYVMLILLALGAAWSWPQAIGALIVAAGVVIAQR